MAQIDSANFAHLDGLSAAQLKRLLVEQLTRQKLGLYWEHDSLDRDRAINEHVVLPRVVPELCHRDVTEDGTSPYRNLIIEGDNFDSLRMLRATHAGKIRVIYIDPPYNTGNKDWVYNDRFVGQNDRWRHSLWLEFLYRRLTLARDLLTPDGLIMVSINDENRSRLELLMDEIFPGRRIGTLVWRTKDTGNDLSRRLSHVHEHVLLYGNPGFRFNGKPTDRSKFRNPDNDPRGDWSPQPMTANKTFIERRNTYYPIQDPNTGYWYPCDPSSVWRFSSAKAIRERLKGDEAAIAAELASLDSDTIETFIEKKLIYFPPVGSNQRIMKFDTIEALRTAIANGTGPALPKKKTPLFFDDLPDLEFWVGKPIAPGRPSRKEHWSNKAPEERLSPFGSWIAGMNEQVANLAEEGEDEPATLRSTRGGVATDEIKAVLGSKAFPYPKPSSLLNALLSQATQPNDVVLDFFAGSGTTGQAVLQLNAEDGGQRRFILCSSTESTTKEPLKNVCRDVCAKRMRRVMSGYSGKSGLGGSFAYVQMDRVEPPDVAFDATSDNASALLALRLTHKALPPSKEPVQLIASDPEGGVDTVFVPVVDEAAIEILSTWPSQRIAVYSPRPDTVVELLAARGREVNSYGLQEALLRGQTRARRTAKANQAIERGGRHE
ncbi:MAG: site-specific DNA-methyltransferase [Casimicrobium sp.]